MFPSGEMIIQVLVSFYIDFILDYLVGLETILFKRESMIGNVFLRQEDFRARSS
jgi:hypothetical protein